jgi:hypothetical protein
MSIPAGILTETKDLLRITDTLRDAEIQNVYERVLQNLCNMDDLFVVRQDIDAVMNQSIYTVHEFTVRILAVLHNRVQLSKATSWSADLSQDWQAEGSGTPNFWFQDKIPPTLDSLPSVTPKQFVVHPAPNASGTGASGLYVYTNLRPLNDTPTFTWINHYLALKTASEFILQNTEELDPENSAGPSQDVAIFFGEVASLWMSLWKDRIG